VDGKTVAESVFPAKAIADDFVKSVANRNLDRRVC